MFNPLDTPVALEIALMSDADVLAGWQSAHVALNDLELERRSTEHDALIRTESRLGAFYRMEARRRGLANH